jgi:hypothetical protein
MGKTQHLSGRCEEKRMMLKPRDFLNALKRKGAGQTQWLSGRRREKGVGVRPTGYLGVLVKRQYMSFVSIRAPSLQYSPTSNTTPVQPVTLCDFLYGC